jgi:hypothetical protein
MAYFFMIIHRRALPRVWSSCSISKEAAVSVPPGSFVTNPLARRPVYNRSEALYIVCSITLSGGKAQSTLTIRIF